jgi:hypothetical protein
MGIETHHKAEGAEKDRVKGLIRGLQGRREKAAGDPKAAAALRRQIHVLKHKLRKMALAASPKAAAPKA